MGKLFGRAAGLAVGYLADVALADPTRWHPVAGFGSAAQRLEDFVYCDRRAAGVMYSSTLVLGAGILGSRARSFPSVAAVTWVVLGGTSLVRAGRRMADHLEFHETARARELLPSLCGRNPDALDESGLARAALESIAENTSDAAVAPLLWGAVAGGAGLAAYRASNTLDAMVGYRNTRYENFGWACARLDDVLNYVPARWCGVLIAACAPVVGGSPRRAIRTWRRDAHKHPSPNAGVVEAAMAGALGIQVGGATVYPHGIEQRPTLGEGPPPVVADLRRAVTLSAAVQAAAAVSSAALAIAVGKFVRGRHRFGRR